MNQNRKQRFLTAAVLIPLTYLLVVSSSLLIFSLITAVVTLLTAWEYVSLIKLSNLMQRFLYLGCLITGLILLFILPKIFPQSLELFLLLVLIWWIFISVITIAYQYDYSYFSRPIQWLHGLLMLMGCWSGFYLLKQNHQEMFLILLIILVAGADSSAYFVGMALGKTKLASKISPGKTRQGVYAAVLFAGLIGIAAGFYFPQQITIPIVLFFSVLAVVTVLASIMGDLSESLLKRIYGLKDSGKLLPGHGGILDRLDGYLAATPVFVLGVLWIG